MSPLADGGLKSAHGLSVAFGDFTADRFGGDRYGPDTRLPGGLPGAHPPPSRIAAVESLDEVIDAMIADRVIHRHRRIWLVLIALVVAAILVILATGGWKEKKGRTVPTLDAPVTVTAGRFEYNFTKAEIVRKPKTDYSKAEASLQVYFTVKNIDDEEHTSDSVADQLLRFVPGGGKDLVESNGAACHDDKLNWVLVYGLPAEECSTKFEVAPDFTADEVEIGVLQEHFEGDNATLGLQDKPYWHNEDAAAVVRLKPTVRVDDGKDK
jgi:hypothetical protein